MRDAEAQGKARLRAAHFGAAFVLATHWSLVRRVADAAVQVGMMPGGLLCTLCEMTEPKALDVEPEYLKALAREAASDPELAPAARAVVKALVDARIESLEAFVRGLESAIERSWPAALYGSGTPAPAPVPAPIRKRPPSRPQPLVAKAKASTANRLGGGYTGTSSGWIERLRR